MNTRTFPHVAPEILLRKMGDTMKSESYALGYLIRQVGLAYNFTALQKLATVCLDDEPTKRPSTDEILGSLRRIKFSLERQEALERRQERIRNEDKVSKMNYNAGTDQFIFSFFN